MNIQIIPYSEEAHYELVVKLIESEGEEWADVIAVDRLKRFKQALSNSITYVAYQGEVLCGYIRSIHDHGLDIFVIELLVHQNHRGQAIGKQLLSATSASNSSSDCYVLSDADGYYQKLGFKLEGSVFKVQ